MINQASQTSHMGKELENGDFVLLELTMRANGQVVDTTDEDLAEEEGLEADSHRVVVLGEGDIFETVENDLIGKEVGYSAEIDVPPEEAFGEYDPEKVNTISAEKIPEDKRRPGEQVEIEGKMGRLETIIGGRARVDFNHPLAGQEIECNFKVKEKIEETKEKAKALVENYIDEDIEAWIETEIENKGEKEEREIEILYLEVSENLMQKDVWPLIKQNLMQEILNRLNIDKIIVREVFK